MKKGRIYTCNGCYAFEDSVRVCPYGSEAAYTSTNPFCGIGIDIEKIKDKPDYKPVGGVCGKPKTIADLVRLKKAFYDSIMIKNQLCLTVNCMWRLKLPLMREQKFNNK